MRMSEISWVPDADEGNGDPFTNRTMLRNVLPLFVLNAVSLCCFLVIASTWISTRSVRGTSPRAEQLKAQHSAAARGAGFHLTRNGSNADIQFWLSRDDDGDGAGETTENGNGTSDDVELQSNATEEPEIAQDLDGTAENDEAHDTTLSDETTGHGQVQNPPKVETSGNDQAESQNPTEDDATADNAGTQDQSKPTDEVAAEQDEMSEVAVQQDEMNEVVSLTRSNCDLEIQIKESEDMKLTVRYEDSATGGGRGLGLCQITISGERNISLAVLVTDVRLNRDVNGKWSEAGETLKVVTRNNNVNFTVREYRGNENYYPVILTESNKAYLVYEYDSGKSGKVATGFDVEIFNYRKMENNVNSLGDPQTVRDPPPPPPHAYGNSVANVDNIFITNPP